MYKRLQLKATGFDVAQCLSYKYSSGKQNFIYFKMLEFVKLVRSSSIQPSLEKTMRGQKPISSGSSLYELHSGKSSSKEIVVQRSNTNYYIYGILTRKKDSLWVKWCHTYVIKGRCMWTLKCKQNASWKWRKILKLRLRLMAGK